MITTKLSQKLKTRLLADNSLTHKASLNAVAAGLDYGARLLVGFVINPLLVAGLGDYGYGVWQVLGRMIGYISPATGRPTQALKWTIASQQASTDFDFKRRQIGNALVVLIMFAPLLALMGGVLAWFAPIWLEAPALFYTPIRLAAVLLVVNLLLVSLVELPRSVLEGENLGYKRMGLTASLVLAGGGLTWLAIYFQTGLIGVSAANLAATLLTGLLFYQVVRSYVPWFGVARPTWEGIRGFAGLSGWFLLWNLVMKTMTASDVVLLGIFGSAELVTSYTLTKYAPETIINVVAIVVFGITPGLGGIIGTGDRQKAARVRSEIMLFTWLMVTVVGTTILLWNQSFLRLWVGANYFAGSLPSLLIILVVMQFVLIRNDANIIDLTLDLRRKVVLGILSAGLSLLIAGVLVRYFDGGIVGLTIGYLVGRLVLSVAYPWQIGRFLEIPFAGQLKGALRPAVITVLLFAGAPWLNQYWLVESWPGLIAAVASTVLLTSALLWLLGLTTSQRRGIWQRVTQVWPGRKS